MRRSRRTNALVIVSDHATKDYYKDTWIDGLLHYEGMGLTGDQRIEFAQNKTLNESQTNGVKVYLFEVLTKGQYTYRGEVKLIDKPYTGKQMDINKMMRNVWIFPIKPI